MDTLEQDLNWGLHHFIYFILPIRDKPLKFALQLSITLYWLTQSIHYYINLFEYDL